VGCLGSIILIPLTLLVWTINKIYKEDNGPLFYVQERIGKNGEKFKMIKFRSMCIDADEKLEKFLNENPDVREEFRVYRKIKNDPRITKAGKFLRKTSLDEWPQFLSVLKGDMSLVRTTSIFRKRKRTNGQIL
jgi:undecaprenyl-phosphate galactose phosphotransferase